MGKFLIKKKISLDFLGDEYKECYIEFSSMPIAEYKEFVKKGEAVRKANENMRAVDLMTDKIKEHFLGGKLIGEEGLFDMAKEDIDQFDINVILKVFSYMTGEELDPKV